MCLNRISRPCVRWMCVCVGGQKVRVVGLILEFHRRALSAKREYTREFCVVDRRSREKKKTTTISSFLFLLTIYYIIIFSFYLNKKFMPYHSGVMRLDVLLLREIGSRSSLLAQSVFLFIYL